MLGLDIGTHALYVVRYHAGKVLAYGQCPTPPDSVSEGAVVHPQRVAEALHRLLRTMRVRERKVVLTVGGAQVMTKWVVVPAMSPEELNSAAPLEAPRHLPPTKEPMLYRFWVPEARESAHSAPSENADSTKMPARLVAVPMALAHSRLDTALMAGLEPVGIVPEPDAMTYVLTLNHRPQSVLWRGKATAIVGIRYDHTEMVIARETALEFARTLRLGLNDAIEILQRALGASHTEAEALMLSAHLDEEGTLHFPESLGLPALSMLGFLHALISEMRRLIDFQRSRYPEGSYWGLLDSFLLTGEGTTLKGLANYCARSLGLTCIAGNLFQGIHWAIPIEDLDPDAMNRYTAALGAVMSLQKAQPLAPEATESVAA